MTATSGRKINVTSSPEEIYRTSGRPTTAVGGRLRPDHSSVAVVTEASSSTAANAAVESITAA